MQSQAERTQEVMQKCADTIAFLFDDLRELKGLNSHLDKCILRNLNELTALRNILYRQMAEMSKNENRIQTRPVIAPIGAIPNGFELPAECE